MRATRPSMDVYFCGQPFERGGGGDEDGEDGEDEGQLADQQERISPSPLLLLYFGASWCPACSQFQPLLSDLDEECAQMAADGGPAFDVLYIGADRSGAEWRAAVAELPRRWRALRSADHAACLRRSFSVGGLPSLVVLRAEDGAPVADVGSGRREAAAGPALVRRWLERARGAEQLPTPPPLLPAALPLSEREKAAAAAVAAAG
eukprot:COSAG01_NODE_12024_length_1813_cov_10.789382_1_plen_205_part_00